MATVSVKLKIIADRETKKMIQKAHNIFNENVKAFEEFLLLIRGKDYYYEDVNGEECYKSVDEVQEELKKYFLKRGIVDNLDICVEALSGLESVIRSKGSQAAGMLAKLYNAESNAGMNNISKIVDPVPEWVTHYSESGFDDDKYREEADLWIKSEVGQKAIAPIIKGSGHPSSFKIAYTTGKEWYSKFIKDQEKYRKDLKDGLARILFVLDREGVFPLIDVDQQLLKDYPVWVRLMLKTALENYASYLACDETTRLDYKKVKEAFEKIEQRVKTEYAEQLSAVQKYLNDNYIQTDRSLYLTRRMCRGLDMILFEWKTCKNYEERVQVLNNWQADSEKKHLIGDANFLRWIAKEEYIYISKGDCLDVLLEYYDFLRQKEMKKRCASYTVADPINSKRYLFYEGENGTNYDKYELLIEENHIKIKLPLLIKDNKNRYAKQIVVLNLANSKQFQSVEKLEDGKISFTNEKHLISPETGIVEKEKFVGKLGGADLRVETTAGGRLTGLFMSFTISLDDMFDDGQRKMANDVLYCFSRAYDGKKSKYDDKLTGNTIRALSVDLGLKQFCAGAVGQVVYGTDLITLPEIKYERMFLIKMSGDKATSKIEQQRQNALKELNQLRSEIRYISLLKRIYNQDSEGRKKILERSAEYYKHPDKQNIILYCLNVEDQQKVNECLCDEYSRMMDVMNIKMKEFRSGEITKKQERKYKPGKTYWSIYYLEQLRKLLMAWNSLGYKISDDSHTMNRAYGITATHLLEHIQNLKEDRIKSGADLIIQAARGFYYDDAVNCWIQKYEPCQVIVFEDLSRYRFSLDRPKRENSKLMKWSHQEIIEEVKRQADIYGISVYDSTDAAYSSKFCYKTEAPGIRCDRLEKQDFESEGVLKEHVYERLPEAFKRKAGKLKPGQIIPSEIGSLFTTLDAEGNLYYINADMNAACNLLKRFFGMHTHLLRLNTINKDGYLYIKNTQGNDEDDDEARVGKRNKGQFLYNYGKSKMMLTTSDKSGHFYVDKKEKSTVAPYVGNDRIYNLFHDPSGYILPSDEWIGYKEFWDSVNDIIVKKLIDLL